MERKMKGSRGPEATSEDDFWPAFVAFSLSQKAWWVGLCAEFDLTAMQGHTLRSLDPERPVAMSALAEALTCEPSNVTGIVDKLESRGLIERQGAEHDRRIKMLAVTRKGRLLREQLWARTMEPPAAVKALSADARRQLAAMLRAIVAERTGAADRAR
jgi:DNA-binding MarR family transcriptional regulator